MVLLGHGHVDVVMLEHGHVLYGVVIPEYGHCEMKSSLTCDPAGAKSCLVWSFQEMVTPGTCQT